MGNSIKNIQEVLAQMEKILRGQYEDMIVIVAKGDELTITVPNKHIQKMADRTIKHVLNEAAYKSEAINRVTKQLQFHDDAAEILHRTGYTRSGEIATKPEVSAELLKMVAEPIKCVSEISKGDTMSRITMQGAGITINLNGGLITVNDAAARQRLADEFSSEINAEMSKLLSTSQRGADSHAAEPPTQPYIAELGFDITPAMRQLEELENELDRIVAKFPCLKGMVENVTVINNAASGANR